jgi:PHD/YefM family antitoxin component YafN of YafNO toxin-antitoxin module
MINIRPVSDLRNKYPEIEDLVLKENESVYLTKNGYGSMVVMSLEKYSQIMKQLDIERAIEAKFGNIKLEDVLYELDDEIENSDTKYLTHDEVFSKIRRKTDGN